MLNKHSNAKPMECQFCNFKSKIPAQLKFHVKTKHKDTDIEGLLTCIHCSRMMPKNDEELCLDHCKMCVSASRIDSSFRFVCFNCNYHSIELMDMRTHIRKHTGWEPYEYKYARKSDCVCQYCNEMLSGNRLALLSHASLCSAVTRPDKSFRYVCYKCDYHSQKTNNFSNHILRHLQIKKYLCPYCPYRAVTRTVVKHHMIYRHSNAKRMECQFCNFTSKLPSQLKFHVKHKHKDLLISGDNANAQKSEDCVCQYCNEMLSGERLALVSHARLCSGVTRPDKSFTYVCYKCNYHTQFTGHFSDHILRHLRLKKYGCPYCPFRAVTRTVVKSHMIYRHSNVKRMECQFCNFTSKLSSQIKFHVRHKHKDLLINADNASGYISDT
ncbi:hypothetical protein M8J77_004127 [Diaphorina citri]|nr:hypothetical protein M8J77_004127 [Diaphorina citri]